MKLIDFNLHYPDEASCRSSWRKLRESEGVKCKKCGCENHYWKKDKEAFECKKCKFRTSLRSGTVMENSNLPFRHWFLAMHLMTSMKQNLSALEMQKQIGHKRYEPIWEMAHKLRIVMGKRDSIYQLEGLIELDEGFFEHADLKTEKVETEKVETEKVAKRGRGSQRQTKVLVMTSVETLDIPTNKQKDSTKNTRLKYVKMLVINDLKADTIKQEVEVNIQNTATVKTDGFRGYAKIKDAVAQHVQKVIPPKEASKELPWVHTIISNAKRKFSATYFQIHAQYFQNYLNEFCFKVNRRFFGEKLFDRILHSAILYTPYG